MPDVIRNTLTIAGSDPSGGAGIQADLKTFSALGCYGASVVTALTAQNTQGVRAFTVVAPEFVAAQIDAVFDDLRIDAVKIGMVATAAVARAIADRLRHYCPSNIVLDPVMVAKSGDRLLQDDAIAAIREHLLPLASVITPNLPEAAVLCGTAAPTTLTEMHDTARALQRLGAAAVLLKGGALTGDDSPDLLLSGTDSPERPPTGSGAIELPARRIATHNTHGTGCTLSAALAALLTRHPLPEAARLAKAYLTAALAASERLTVGHGRGPVHHFHALWTEDRA
jgi:hydroxymethylpyrimidine/phosphomethylpyrimidine kinase